MHWSEVLWGGQHQLLHVHLLLQSVPEKLAPYFAITYPNSKGWYIYMHQLEGNNTAKGVECFTGRSTQGKHLRIFSTSVQNVPTYLLFSVRCINETSTPCKFVFQGQKSISRITLTYRFNWRSQCAKVISQTWHSCRPAVSWSPISNRGLRQNIHEQATFKTKPTWDA